MVKDVLPDAKKKGKKKVVLCIYGANFSLALPFSFYCISYHSLVCFAEQIILFSSILIPLLKYSSYCLSFPPHFWSLLLHGIILFFFFQFLSVLLLPCFHFVLLFSCLLLCPHKCSFLEHIWLSGTL